MAALLPKPCPCALQLRSRQRSTVLCIAGSQAKDAYNRRSVSRRGRAQPIGLPTFETSILPLSASPVSRPVPLELELSGLSPLEAQKRLTGRVKAARSLSDFAAIIAAGGRLIDAICLVAILSGLPRAVQRTALPVIANTPAPAPAAGAGSGSSNAAVAQKQQLQLSEQDARELSGLVTGVVGLVRIRLREFDSNGLVTVAVGLAKLSCHVPVEPGVFRALLSAVEPRLQGLGTKALANLMWALATAGVQPCGSWLSGYYSALERQLESFSGPDLANTMWGLAKLDLMPEVWLMDQLCAACLASLQRSRCAGDGATVLTCLARYYCAYNYRLPDEVMGAFLVALQPGLRSGMPGDLVAIVHSAVCMSHMPSRPFMMELYAVLLDRLTLEPTLSYADFSRALWSLSRVDCAPPRSWLREFVEVAHPKLAHLRPRGLSELIWALACWDARPSPRFLDEFFRASERRLPDYAPAQIADTLSALAKLGCRAPSPWLGSMLASFCAVLPDARSHELVCCLEAAVAVADDRAWLAEPHTRSLLQLIADTAAAKFDAFDACSHARLVLALARANLCPGAAWLRQQQASLASAWSAEGSGDRGAEGGEGGSRSGGMPAGIDTATAAGLRQAYSQWDVQLEPVLAAELEGMA
ncbi:hypothetical protein GPECTOR_22g765 [Gonium pectorale]|uniref:FAST kinase leucine-rich domain-containing protein n=1 Tax=Gonium pectorale TaxID=33097 RepID=A0A150GHS1_GONPE|nr:hypothetical protein GPECTOR_22g765 [Gonium pectorale]|eukprot:KXZ49175.1 hypothetical protein GPECTOR_22g765 [Gonium pectorale]